MHELGDFQWRAAPSEGDSKSADALLVRCRRSAQLQPRLLACLAPAELAHAEGLPCRAARVEFVQSRGTLRSVLGLLLSREPARLPIQLAAGGKPLLEDAALAFSVSHSGEWLLYGFTRSPWIGVDVEQVRPLPSALGLAARFFTERERDALAQLQGDALQQAFFTCWTRKEAYLKGCGAGVGAALGEIDVGFDAEGPWPVTPASPKLPNGVLHALHVDDAHVAAVALPRGVAIGRRCEARVPGEAD